MLLSISMIIYFLLLFTDFISFSYSISNTIGIACNQNSSNCGSSQACINQYCECNPSNHYYWAGEEHGCRVCPSGFYRKAKRCYKHFAKAKNYSEARADCRSQQADLYSWRDNTDENELLAATQNMGRTKQFYSWSGGIVHHGKDYKITWFDPKAPPIYLSTDNPLTTRFCNKILVDNYEGKPEPSRLTKNGEKENCVSFVFIPQQGSHASVCLADDFCSTQMSYICEYTETSLLNIYASHPSEITTTTDSIIQMKSTTEVDEVTTDIYEETEAPSALGENEDSSLSNILIYIIGGIVFLVIVGIVAFIIIRKQKQKNEKMNISPTTSIDSSAQSDVDV